MVVIRKMLWALFLPVLPAGASPPRGGGRNLQEVIGAYAVSFPSSGAEVTGVVTRFDPERAGLTFDACGRVKGCGYTGMIRLLGRRAYPPPSS